jgi:hypothetical protein
MPEFTVIGCHCNRAGEASVSLRHTNGAIVSVQHIPFSHDYSESVGAECDRIQRAAVALARAAVAFLEAAPADQAVDLLATPGAAPDDDQPATRLGQPTPDQKPDGSHDVI